MSHTASGQHLRRFLEELDALYEKAPQLTDTDVREQLAGAIAHALVFDTPGYALPTDFAMMDEGELSAAELNAQVRQIVDRFVTELKKTPDFQEATTEETRMRLIARDDVETKQGNAYWLYLGPWESGLPALEGLRSPKSTPVPPPSSTRKATKAPAKSQRAAPAKPKDPSKKAAGKKRK